MASCGDPEHQRLIEALGRLAAAKRQAAAIDLARVERLKAEIAVDALVEEMARQGASTGSAGDRCK
jgi:hypothetical protein